jgi:hypothetical protein
MHVPLMIGWCVTSPIESKKNMEPGFSSNWGYCSTEESQEGCEGQIDTSIQ